MSVRNVRFYTTKGLVPPPIRRGRSGYYTADHVARLELVQELQSHGFTLSAIERYVANIPRDATPEDIALQRTMLAPWQHESPIEMSRAELDKRAGRTLSDDDLTTLAALGRGLPGQARQAPGGGLPALGRPRPARPRLPDRGRARRRRRVRRPRPADRRGALRGLPHQGLAGLQGVRAPPRSGSARSSSGSSRCRSPAWSQAYESAMDETKREGIAQRARRAPRPRTGAQGGSGSIRWGRFLGWGHERTPRAADGPGHRRHRLHRPAAGPRAGRPRH